MIRTLRTTLNLCILYAAWLWILIRAFDVVMA